MEVGEMKKTRKKLLAFLMAICMVIGIAVPRDTSQAATSYTTYDGGYGIDEILSQFQFFTSGDVTLDNSGHTVGSVAVGGTLNMSNSFGDAGIVPSYIYNHKNGYLGNGWHGQVPIKSNVVYYGTASGTVNDPNWYQNANYIDMEDAFDEVKEQSAYLANMKDNQHVSLTNGSLVIDLTGVSEDTYVNIDFADFKAAYGIEIKVDDADWFSKHICLINVVGANGAAITYDGYSKVKIAGQSSDTGIESMSGADKEFNKQLNFSGMNLVWNFPDATGTITVQGLGGHLVAPRAAVHFNSGNYEGGVIARTISGGAQGHFYPMSLGLPNSTPVVTTDATFSKKAVSADGTELAGASMKLTYVAGSHSLIDVAKAEGNGGPDIEKALDNKSITWESNGTALELTKLPEGEYVLSETAAPQGYKYATEIAFKVASDGSEGKIYQKDSNGNYMTTPTTTLTMVDEAKAGSTVIKGTKIVVGTTTEDVFEFTLYAADKTTVLDKVECKGAGIFYFDEIHYGPSDIGEHTYYVKETRYGNASSYDDNYKEVKVTVTEGKNALITKVTSEEIIIKNTYSISGPVSPDADITITKNDDEGTALVGATLKLAYASGAKNMADVVLETSGGTVTPDSKDDYAIVWKSVSQDIVFKKLHPGEYVLSEIDAPEGYKLAEDIMFKVIPPADPTSQVAEVYLKKADGSYDTTPITSITMTDEKKTGSATIKGTKIVSGDVTDEEFEFQLLDANGTVVATDTTVGAGVFEFDIPCNEVGTYTYTVKEVAGSTTGMTYDTAAKTVTVTVSDNGGENLEAVVTGDVTITNKYKKQSTVITPVVSGTTATLSKKAISADGDEVPGASMKLSYTGPYDLRHVTHSNTDGLAIEIIDNNKAVTWTSGTTPLVLKGLPDGEYVLTETAAPKGYDYASDMKFKITDGKVYQALTTGGYSTSPNPTITMVDEAKVGSIKLTGTKKLTGQKAPAETYNFVVMEGDTQVATGSVNGAGNITFTEIKYQGADDLGKHTYTITEKAGTTENMFYSKAKLTVVVNVSDDGAKGGKLQAKVVSADSDAIEFTNKYTIPGNLIVTVYDEITKDVVPNADVEITDPQGTETTYKTDGNGQIKLEKVEPGDYYIETVKVPEGYTVSLGKTETAEVVAGDTTEHEVYITIPGGLIVTVYDEKTGETVPDATVEITNPDGTKEEYKTDSNGQITIENAPPGDYVIETIEVPSGYEVTLGKTETATVVSKDTTEHDVYIDISTPGNLIITVYDEKTGDTIPGATVEVTDFNGDTKEYTTDANGQITIKDLTPGKYDIETTKVPDGYDVTLGKSDTAMVEPDKTTSHDVYINTEEPGALIVTVFDEKTKEVVPGATVEITDPSGNTKEYTTDENGKITIKDLDPGKYQIVTTKVPEGYTVTLGKTETAIVESGKTTSHDVYINTSDKNTTDTTVKTGDRTNLVLPMILLVLSGLGFVIVSNKKRKI